MTEAELFAAYGVERVPPREVRAAWTIVDRRGPLGVVGLTLTERFRRALDDELIPVGPQLAKVA